MQLVVVALLGLGLVMVHSAGMTIDGERGDTIQWMLGRPAIYAAGAVLAMLLASRIDVRNVLQLRGLANPLGYLVIASLVLVGLTLIPGVGRTVYGASRWLTVGPQSWRLSFQPSELVKWTLPIAVAWWCARRRATMHRVAHGLLPPLALIAVGGLLVGIEDLGTAALIGMVAIVLLFAGGARWWHLLLTVAAGAAAVAWAIIRSPYRYDRLVAFLDPWADAHGSGYHSIQSMLAVAMGGPTGRGLGGAVFLGHWLWVLVIDQTVIGAGGGIAASLARRLRFCTVAARRNSSLAPVRPRNLRRVSPKLSEASTVEG